MNVKSFFKVYFMNCILPKVTIIVPVYKVQEYIEDCILSIMSQTYNGEMECIIVDDCTPDDSIIKVHELIDNYEGTIQFKIIHHKENKGLSAARNTGLEYAKGEYVYFLDSDDEICQTCIQDLAEPLAEKKFDFVIGDYSTKGNLTFETPKLQLNTGEVSNNEDIVSSYESAKWYMMAWNKLCSLKFIIDNNLFFKESIIHEDDLWSFQLACLANNMFIVKKSTYIYRLRSNSIMSSTNKYNHFISYIIIINLMSEFVCNYKVIGYYPQKIINNYKLVIINDSIKNKSFYNTIYPELRNIKGDISFCLTNSLKGKIINYIGNCYKVLPSYLGKYILYYYIRLLQFRPLYKLMNVYKRILSNIL